MSDVTQILDAIEQGDPSAAEQLLPLVYAELRRLAAARLAHETPGQTLEATALVHEAYLRLVDVEQAQHWNSRGHFFAAAAEAMRRILVERARYKGRIRHGGGLRRLDLLDAELAATTDDEQVLLLDECPRSPSRSPAASGGAGQTALLCRPDPRRDCACTCPFAADSPATLGLRSRLAAARHRAFQRVRVLSFERRGEHLKFFGRFLRSAAH